MEPAYAETVLQEAKLQAEESEKLLRQAHDEEPPQVPYFQARTRVMEGGCDEVAFDLPVPLPQPPTDLVKAETDDELPTPCLSPNEAVLSSRKGAGTNQAAPGGGTGATPEGSTGATREGSTGAEPCTGAEPIPGGGSIPSRGRQGQGPISKGLKKRKPKQQPAKESREELVSKPDCVKGASSAVPNVSRNSKCTSLQEVAGARRSNYATQRKRKGEEEWKG